MKKIKAECLGMVINYKAHNGVKFEMTINENDIEFYSTIGLDIFEDKPISKATIVEVIEEVKPVEKKKNATTKTSK